MNNYEIIIRIQDPAFDGVQKKAIPISKDVAMKLWDRAKNKKQAIEIEDGGMAYLVSPGDVLQVRQANGHNRHGGSTPVGQYKKQIIGAMKIIDGKLVYMIEESKIQKAPEGWNDAEYRKLATFTAEVWKKMTEEQQEDEFLKAEQK